MTKTQDVKCNLHEMGYALWTEYANKLYAMVSRNLSVHLGSFALRMMRQD